MTRLSKLLNSTAINVADWVPIVGDGVTDNTTAFQTFAGGNPPDAFNGNGVCKTIGNSFPTEVTLTLGSPGIVNWTGHGLRVNEAVTFTTTDALPTGLTVGTTYYVMYADLTADSFQVSATNAWAGLVGDGAAANFTGSQSGTQSCIVQGSDWQTVVIPPGSYHLSQNSLLEGDQRKLRVLGYGVATVNLNPGTTYALAFGYGGYKWSERTVSAPIKSVGSTASTITLVNAADASKFWVGGWVCIACLDLQNAFGFAGSWPPNNHYFEFVQVTAINSGTGVLTFLAPLKNSYHSSFPTFYYGPPVSSYAAGGGAATVYPMSPNWDMDIEIYGLHDTTAGQLPSSVRSVRWIDCAFDGQGAIPSVARSFVMERCRLNISGNLEIDKLIEYARFTDCIFGARAGIKVQSSSVDRLIVEGCNMFSLSGTAKLTHIKDCFIQNLTIGPLAFGASEAVLIENSRIGNIYESIPLYDQGGQPSEFGMLLNNWSFSGGTLQQPMISTAGNNWAVPGRKMYVNDLAGNFASMGSPFIVLDVYQTASPQATVTISIASPAVVGWTAHGLSADAVVAFATTGALPTGLSPATPYYVLSSGLTANSFQISTSPGGSPVDTTGSQSGTQTGMANPMFNIDTTLAALPAGNSTSSTVTIPIASPTVVDWTAHGLTAGTPICFLTTGALPTGMRTTVRYYVLAAGLTADSFEFSTSAGGAAVNTSGSQSGTQTCVANPLKFSPQSCPRVTVRNCTGCVQITDLSNGPDNAPLYSYASRQYIGYIESPPLAGYVNSLAPFVYGNLVSLTIDVIRPYTGSQSTYAVDVTAAAFEADLVEQDLSQTINLKTAGTRVITPSATTGSQPGDTLTEFSNWISGSVNYVLSQGLTNESFAELPIVKITIQTDQGMTDPVNLHFGGPSEGHSTPIVDTTVVALET